MKHAFLSIAMISALASIFESCGSGGSAVSQKMERDTMVKILWRADTYDRELKDTFFSIVINEAYCKTISDEERAALGYVATFTGNECWWDGQARDDRSNLKCKLLTALDMGYQCSSKHLGFLRKWFRNDTNSLRQLEDCPTIPYTATIQSTFDEITLTRKGDKISVTFKAQATNLREQSASSWTVNDFFEVRNNSIMLVKTNKSEVKQEHFGLGE